MVKRIHRSFLISVYTFRRSIGLLAGTMTLPLLIGGECTLRGPDCAFIELCDAHPFIEWECSEGGRNLPEGASGTCVVRVSHPAEKDAILLIERADQETGERDWTALSLFSGYDLGIYWYPTAYTCKAYFDECREQAEERQWCGFGVLDLATFAIP